MTINRIVWLIMTLCAFITLSGCGWWDEVKNVFRYKEFYEQTLSELTKYKSYLEETKKEVNKCKENWNQALAKADEYKYNWKQALVSADEYKKNWNQALAKADEYKKNWEVTKVAATKANAKVLALQDDVKELGRRLRSTSIETEKAKLIIIGLKKQLERYSDGVKKR